MGSKSTYEIDYNDKRFTEVETEKQEALTEMENTYDGMIDSTDSLFQNQIDESKKWADKQTELQQERTDFEIEKIQQEEEKAYKDYQKEQSAAYVDYQKGINEHGVNAEQMADNGLDKSGYSESSKVSMFNTYQKRITTAREVYNNALLNYKNAMTEARLQNNSVLAEIAKNAAKEQLELSLQGFQYKNQLILEKANKKMEIDSIYYARYQDTLNQINHENALQEEIRQYNTSLAEQRRQHDASLALEREALNIKKNNQQIGIIKDKEDEETNPIVEWIEGLGKKSQPTEIDMQSVIDLGYGPISPQKLNTLVENGEVVQYEDDGFIKFKKK